MVLTRVEQPLGYGIVITDEEGRILRFLEKPAWGEVFSDTINTGIYLLEPSVFGTIPPQRPYDFGKELFPALLASGRSLWGHVARGYWRDVGDLTEYRTAHIDLLQGAVGVDIPGERHEGAGHTVWLDEGARVDYSARLTGSVIVGRNAHIAPGAREEVALRAVRGIRPRQERGVLGVRGQARSRLRCHRRAPSGHDHEPRPSQGFPDDQPSAHVRPPLGGRGGAGPGGGAHPGGPL